MRKGIEHLLRTADVPNPERAESLWAEYRGGGATADGAFATLLAWYGGPLYRRIWGFVRSDAADDLFQDVFARLHRERGRLRTFADALRWVRVVAVTHCVDAHRRATRRAARERAQAVPVGAEDSSGARFDLDEALRVTLGKLSAREQQAVALVYFEGLTRQDAAAVAGVNRDTFAKTLDGALARLRTALAAAGAAGVAVTATSVEAALAVRPAFVSHLRLADLATGAWGKPAPHPVLRVGGWLACKKGLLAGVAAVGLVVSVALVTWSLVRPTRLGVERLESRGNPSGGVLDTTFGPDGGVTLPFDSQTGRTVTAVQADGKILVANASLRKATIWGGDAQPTVTRLHPNGSIDTSFGTNGTAHLPVAKSGAAMAVALQPDGKILVGARATLSSEDGEYAVARLNTNGTLDTTFGNQSGWWISNPSKRGESVQELAVVGTGAGFSIYVGGNAVAADGKQTMVAIRLTSAGLPDQTYGVGGFVSRPVNSNVADMAVTPTGRVVIAGLVVPPGGGVATAVLVAFTPTGQPDTGFDGDGVAYPAPLPGVFTVNAFALAAQGESVLVAGRAAWGPGVGLAGVVFRVTAAGAVDPTFATDGVFVGPGRYSMATTSQFKDIALAADGSVVISGFAARKNANGTTTGALLLGRLSADGQPDVTFGPTPDGTGLHLLFDPPPGANGTTTLSLDADGNMIIGGIVGNPSRSRVLRFTGH